MRARKLFPFHRKFLTAAGFAALLAVALAPPATAADNDYQGWFAALDIAFTQPTSLDHHFADNLDDSGVVPVFRRLVLDNDTDTTFRAGIGFSWGDRGSLRVSYWGFDNDDSASGVLIGPVFPQVIGYSYYYPSGQYLLDPNFAATSTVEASTVDIDFIRPIEVGNSVTLKWLAGLRVAQFEEDQGFFGEDAYYLYTQDKHFESDAVGLRVGLTGVMEISELFSLETGFVVSFMQADTEGSGRVSDDLGATVEIFEASDDSIRGEIRDYWIEAVWSTRHLDWVLGYWVSNWDGMVTNPIDPIVNQFGPSGVPGNPRSREEIEFNSAYGGIRWRFGGGP